MRRRSKWTVLLVLILIVLTPLACLGVLTLSVERAWVEIRHYMTLKEEQVGEYEQSVMASCRLGGSKSYTAQVDGADYIIPLPDGSTEFANNDYPEKEGFKQYMAVSEVFWAYVQDMEHLDGYHFDRFGNIISIASNDGKMRFGITRSNYARKYELFVVDVARLIRPQSGDEH